MPGYTIFITYTIFHIGGGMNHTGGMNFNAGGGIEHRWGYFLKKGVDYCNSMTIIWVSQQQLVKHYAKN